MKKLESKITGFRVVNKDVPTLTEEQENSDDFEEMHEKVKRPDILIGSTYKIKTPVTEHALYLTINDIVLNEGTEFECRRPFEIFINSKNMDSFQWVLALTRVMSAVFRKGGDIAFLVEELRNVFDPKGGYFKRGGKYMPSLVAEIGEAIEDHLIKCGMIASPELSKEQKKLIEEKKDEIKSSKSSAMDKAEVCPKCHEKQLVILDGCRTCLSCGDSKCG